MPCTRVHDGLSRRRLRSASYVHKSYSCGLLLSSSISPKLARRHVNSVDQLARDNRTYQVITAHTKSRRIHDCDGLTVPVMEMRLGMLVTEGAGSFPFSTIPADITCKYREFVSLRPSMLLELVDNTSGAILQVLVEFARLALLSSPMAGWVGIHAGTRPGNRLAGDVLDFLVGLFLLLGQDLDLPGL